MSVCPFRNIDLRCVEIDGEPWFVTGDICRVLELSINAEGQPNVTVATKKLDAGEASFYPIETRPGYTRKTHIIKESGLYKLIMRSDKPEAKDFQHWDTAVVLPAIRKDGKRPG